MTTLGFFGGSKPAEQPLTLGAELRAKADKVNSDTKTRVVGELKALMITASEAGKYELSHPFESDLKFHFTDIVKMLEAQEVIATKAIDSETVLLTWGKQL